MTNHPPQPEDPLPETAWATRTLRRWRRGWAGLYLLVAIMAFLFSRIPISVFAAETGVTLWHWPAVIGGPVAMIGLRLRRPFVELTGVVLCLVTLAAYVIVATVIVVTAQTDRSAGGGLAVLVGLPVYMLIFRIIDVWTFPRKAHDRRFLSRWWRQRKIVVSPRWRR